LADRRRAAGEIIPPPVLIFLLIILLTAGAPLRIISGGRPNFGIHFVSASRFLSVYLSTPPKQVAGRLGQP
jgi:hypothetical protein